MPRVIHGTGNGPQGNWFPWLTGELAQRGIETITPQFPTPEGQTLTTWLHTFAPIAKTLTPDDIVIGHSIGVVFALQAIQHFRLKLRAVFLVAGFLQLLGSAEYDPLIKSFVIPPLDFEFLHSAVPSYTVYASLNDPYVPIRHGLELTRNLKRGCTLFLMLDILILRQAT